MVIPWNSTTAFQTIAPRTCCPRSLASRCSSCLTARRQSKRARVLWRPSHLSQTDRWQVPDLPARQAATSLEKQRLLWGTNPVISHLLKLWSCTVQNWVHLSIKRFKTTPTCTLLASMLKSDKEFLEVPRTVATMTSLDHTWWFHTIT